MDKKFIIRQVDPSEDAQIRDFMDLVHVLDERDVDPGQLRKSLEFANREESTHLIVAEDTEAKKLVGTLTAFIHTDYCGECKKVMYVENAAVLPEYQGEGIGRAMFSYIETWGLQQNVEYLNLTSSMFRKGAHQFYRTLGYEEVKGFRKYLQ